MDFFNIPVGTIIKFKTPPYRFGKMRVFTLGKKLEGENRRAINHRNTANWSVSEQEWKDWGGEFYKQKPITLNQKVKELEKEVKRLQAKADDLQTQLNKQAEEVYPAMRFG